MTYILISTVNFHLTELSAVDKILRHAAFRRRFEVFDA